MELTYTSEKREKETIKMFFRRRMFLNDLRLGAAIMSVLWLMVAIACYVLIDIDQMFPLCSLSLSGAYALLGTGIFLLCFFLLDRFFVLAPRSTLEALVPECLAVVPRDPWSKTGEPMKYDAAFGVVWSAGKKGDYDYRNVVEGRISDSGDMATDDYTARNAFRINVKPMNFRQ